MDSILKIIVKFQLFSNLYSNFQKKLHTEDLITVSKGVPLFCQQLLSAF